MPAFSRTSKAQRVAMLQRLHAAVISRAEELRDAPIEEYGGPVSRASWASQYAAEASEIGLGRRTVGYGESSMAVTAVNIEICATADLLNLIRRAAAASQMTPEAFMLEASVVAAHAALGAQSGFAASAAQMADFERIINRPLAENDAIQKLLAGRSLWER